MANDFPEIAPILSPVWQRRRLVLGVVALSAMVGVAYTLYAPKVWEAEATIIFPVRQPSVLGVTGSESGALASALGAPTPVRVYTGILESTRTIEYVANSTGLKRKEVKQMSKVLDQTMENSITVLARSRDAELARKIVELNLEALEKINEDLNMPLAENDVFVLTQRIEGQRETIAKFEGQLLEFQNGAVTAPGVTSTGSGKEATILAAPSNWVGSLRELEIQHARVDSEIGQVMAWSDRVADDKDELPTPFPGAEKWRTTLAELEYELRVAQLSYSPTAPEVQKLEEQIQIARKQLDNELTKHIEATRQGFIAPTGEGNAKLPALLANRVALEAQMKAVQRLAQLAPAEAIELSQLMREIATNTVILQQLEAQLQVATLQEARDPNRWEVLDAPRISEEPINKSFARNGALSLIVGLFLAFSLAMALGRKPEKQGLIVLPDGQDEKAA